MRLGLLGVLVGAAMIVGVGGDALGDPSDPLVQQIAALPWLGVTMDGGADIGVTVQHVVRGSPADKAGIKAGDRIVSVDGGAVTRPAEVSRAVQAHRVGDSVAVGVERRGSAVSAAVTLAARPAGDDILKMDLVGAPAPAWTNATPLAGAPTSLDKLKGRVVIVDFWATWCGPCRRQIPELVALYEKYNKSRGLVVIGVSCDLIQGDGVKAVAPFVEEFRINYPIAMADEQLVDRMGIEGIPTTLFIGADGRLVSRIVGAGHTGEISASAMQLLNGGKGDGAPRNPEENSGHVVDISVVR
jgi:thiol-disulfide isomerase/thioredoxin